MTQAIDQGRRKLLRVGLATALCAWAGPALANVPRGAARSIALANLHTGENLRVDYWVNGRYLHDALHAVNVNLRDFRTGDVYPIDPQLLDLLDALRRKLGTRAPYQVISGYRSPKTNALLREESDGVAAGSLHMSGMAIDIRVPDRALRYLHRAALALERGGVGYYPRSGFIHVDVGRVRHW